MSPLDSYTLTNNEMGESRIGVYMRYMRNEGSGNSVLQRVEVFKRCVSVRTARE
jgi:hypothetical protein